MKFDKLTSLDAFGDFADELHRYGIPELSIKVAEYLEDYKKK